MLRYVLAIWLFLLFAGASQGQECSALSLELLTTPSSPQSVRSLRLTEQALTSQQNGAETVLVGDSQLAFWPLGLLTKYLASESVANYAVAGDRIQNTIWMLPQIAAQQPNPKAVMLWVGTNSLSEPPCAVEKALGGLIEAIQTQWPSARLTVFGIAYKGLLQLEKRKEINEINSFLQQMQIARGFRFVDVAQILDCKYDGFSPAFFAIASQSKSDKDYVIECQYYQSDSLHLTSIGYERVISALYAMR